MVWWMAIPAIIAAAGTVWSAISGKKAADEAAKREADRNALLGQGLDLNKSAYEDWTNNEAAYLKGEIWKARKPGLSDAGAAETEEYEKQRGVALRNLQKMPGAPASTYLALDLEGAKNKGGISLRDKLRKAQGVRENYQLLRQGGAQLRQGVQHSLDSMAGIANQDAAQANQASSQNWGNVAGGMMNLAKLFQGMNGGAGGGAGGGSAGNAGAGAGSYSVGGSGAGIPDMASGG